MMHGCEGHRERERGRVRCCGLPRRGGWAARARGGRVLRSDGDVVDALSVEMQRLVREGLRLAGVLAAVLVGYWLLGVAAVFLMILVLAGLLAGGFDSTTGSVLVGIGFAGAAACFGVAAVFVVRALGRFRGAVQAELDLGVPLLGPGRLLVWISSVGVSAVLRRAGRGRGMSPDDLTGVLAVPDLATRLDAVQRRIGATLEPYRKALPEGAVDVITAPGKRLRASLGLRVRRAGPVERRGRAARRYRGRAGPDRLAHPRRPHRRLAAASRAADRPRGRRPGRGAGHGRPRARARGRARRRARLVPVVGARAGHGTDGTRPAGRAARPGQGRPHDGPVPRVDRGQDRCAVRGGLSARRVVRQPARPGAGGGVDLRTRARHGLPARRRRRGRRRVRRGGQAARRDLASGVYTAPVLLALQQRTKGRLRRALFGGHPGDLDEALSLVRSSPAMRRGGGRASAPRCGRRSRLPSPSGAHPIAEGLRAFPRSLAINTLRVAGVDRDLTRQALATRARASSRGRRGG